MSKATKPARNVDQEDNEGRQPGIPAGWVWRSYELPAPNGDGVIHLDGWGPPEDEAAPEEAAPAG